MQTLTRKSNNITLKDYIHTTNIRRVVMSRSKSKEKEKQRNLSNTSNKISYPSKITSYLELSRNELIQEIKIKLAQLIPSNIYLAPVLNMFDHLVELFSRQLNLQKKQNQIATSIISDHPNLSPKLKNLKSLKETNKEEEKSKSNTLKPHYTQQTQNQDRLETKQAISEDRGHNDSFSTDKDIPNINLLLISKRQESPRFQVQQDTKTTLNDHFNENLSFRNSSRHETSFFERFAKEQEKESPLLGSNARHLYPQSASTSCRNSQINFSIHSSIWNNISQTQNALARFQEYKMKSKR